MQEITLENIEVGQTYFFSFKPSEDRRHANRYPLSGKVVCVEQPFLIIKNDFREKEVILISDVTIYKPSENFVKILND